MKPVRPPIRKILSALSLMSVLLLYLVVIDTASAHELKPAVANIVLSTDGSADAEVLVNLESLIAEIGPQHDDTENSPNRERYEQLRALPSADLQQAFDQFKEKFVSGLDLQTEAGAKMAVKHTVIEVPEVGDLSIVRDSTIGVRFQIPEDATQFSWQWHKDFGEIIVRSRRVDGDIDYAALLSSGQRSDLISVSSVTSRSLVQTLQHYLQVGFAHIIPKGLDHILFVIGLFLLSPWWKPLLLQVTSFTIAHSITLALGVTGLLVLPGSFVEPLIAASIVFVCAENLWINRPGKWRLAVVFAFGLLHGLGFASVLKEIGLETGQFLPALLAFNIGVELGQVCVLVVCFLAIGYWFRQKSWYRQRISIPLSVIIAGIGLYWFLERIGVF